MSGKYRKIKIIVAVLLFSIIYTWFIKRGQETDTFDISVIVITISNLFTVLFIVSLFFKIQADNIKKPVSELKKKLIPSFVFFVLSAVVVSLFIFSLSDYVLFLLKGWDTRNFVENLLYKDIPGTFSSLFIGIFVASVVFFYEIWRQSINREQKLREENLRFRYGNLKAQVNPHFLFNSLNTLSEMVYEDARKTDICIQKLASVYRYILENENVDWVPLNEEIEFVKNYFSLRKERDGEKIKLEIRIENAEKFKIIPISLQILVENALKHNIASHDRPLEINIYREGGSIIVANIMNSKTVLCNPSGIGLVNLRERIKLMTGKEIVINQGNSRFIVKLPLENN